MDENRLRHSPFVETVADRLLKAGGSLWLAMSIWTGLVGHASAQSPDWMRARLLHQRAYHAMAYDTVRQRTVLFGGTAEIDGNTLSETWEWDGAGWTQRSPTTSPSGRSFSAMAYDTARQRVVLFGGRSDTGILADTWEWDGSNWTQRTPTASPGGRYGHSLAYDSARQRVVLFGGRTTSTTFVADTWEWDGTSWTQQSPTTSPKARSNHMMAYDAARKRVVLFGGSDNGVLGDTWEWNGSNWTQISPTTSPSARYGHALAYDAIRQRVVLFGGYNNGVLGDTWEWNGSTWTQLSPTTSPSTRMYHGMVYDVARRRVVLFGGFSFPFLFGDTWEWDGSAWTQRSWPGPGGFPSPVSTYDSKRKRVVLFVGARNQTWEWDGASWMQLSPTTSPGTREYCAIAYDDRRQRVVLFGGYYNGFLGDTWEWDGSNWTQRTPTTSPSARRGHALVYDGARQRVVLFGGLTSPKITLADTWQWDGSNWTQLSPSRSPRRRADHAMAYDAARKLVVLFGGDDSDMPYPTRLNDTWEWDGSSWTQRWPKSSPSIRSNHALAYDIARQRIVLFGGDAGSAAYSDTWEWDGTSWTRISTSSSPTARSNHTMAYDAARQRVVLFGGPLLRCDTWLYGGLAPAITQPFGTGCSSNSGFPVLTSNVPYLGNPAFTMDLLSARPASVCLFGLAAVKQALAIGPCTLYLNEPIVFLAGVTDQKGFAATPRLTIPSKAKLRGVSIYAQASVADPQGLSLSSGLRLVLGD